MTERVVIVGGGAAGMFAAIACARATGWRKDVLVLEAGAGLLRKVKLSGGGRCNFTHACSDVRTFAAHYPRGGKALIGPLHRFGPAQTLAWFAGQGIGHVCEPDGRVFPANESSQTIVDALVHVARAEGVQWRLHAPVREVEARGGRFRLTLESGEPMECEKLLIATGGEGNGEILARMLGHTFIAPVPSLFAFRIQEPWLRALAGLSLENVKAHIPGTRWQESGALLATHWGLSGPVILKLSAWAARDLHDRAYRFPLEIDWLPNQPALAAPPATRVQKSIPPGLPARLWDALLAVAEISPETRWSGLSKTATARLQATLHHCRLTVTGKSPHRAEFVTCGGIPLEETDMKTCQSRRVPGLYFAGELLNIDGLTGGFNLQAAWTTGWQAGTAMGI